MFDGFPNNYLFQYTTFLAVIRAAVLTDLIPKKKNIKAKSVANSVNQGISMARRTHTAYIIGLSINEDLKLKKRKGKDKQ